MDIFHGPSLKLERAKHHIKDFVSKAETLYSKTNPKFFIQDNPQTRQRALCVDVDTSVPDELPLILGDAIHNLRSALDHLTWDVVRSFNPSRPGDVQFPFCRKEEGFKSAISHRQIDLTGEEIVEKFRELKPYPGGNDLLYALHKLDIADKHQLIVPVVSLVGFETLNLREVHPLAPNHTIERTAFRNIAKDNRIAVWTYDPAKPWFDHKGADIEMTVQIMFGKEQPLEGKSVAASLRALAILIDGAITSLTP